MMKTTTLFPRVAAIALAIALALSAAGCSAGYSSSAPSAIAPDMAQNSAIQGDTSYEEAGYDSASIESPAETADSGFTAGKQSATLEQTQNSAGTATLNRKIIKTVDMYMETLEFDTLIDGLIAKTGEFGGYVETSSVSGLGINQSADERYTPARDANVTVRIPTAKLDEFTTLIGALGNVTQKNEGSQDITLTYADTEARKEALSVEYERLMALLEKAESLEAVVALEARLSEVRYELDSLGSALRRYDSLVDFSTVHIHVQEVRRFTPTQKEPETVASRIATGFKETLLDIRDGAGNFAVWFVVNLPYLLIWAVIIAGIVLAIRRLVKTQKAKKTALHPPVPPAGFTPPQKEDTNGDIK